MYFHLGITGLLPALLPVSLPVAFLIGRSQSHFGSFFRTPHHIWIGPILGPNPVTIFTFISGPVSITHTVRDKNFQKDISSLRYELLELNKNYSSQMQTVIGLVNELKAANRTNNRRQSN